MVLAHYLLIQSSSASRACTSSSRRCRSRENEHSPAPATPQTPRPPHAGLVCEALAVVPAQPGPAHHHGLIRPYSLDGPAALPGPHAHPPPAPDPGTPRAHRPHRRPRAPERSRDLAGESGCRAGCLSLAVGHPAARNAVDGAATGKAIGLDPEPGPVIC